MKLHSFENLHIPGRGIKHEDLKPIIGRIRDLAQSPKGYEMWVRNKLGDILALLETKEDNHGI